MGKEGWGIALLLFLLAVSPSRAAENSSDPLSGFNAISDITPPPIPERETVAGAAGQRLYDLTFLLKESGTNQQVTNAHAVVEVTNASGEVFRTLRYIDDSGALGMKLEAGAYGIVVKVDLLNTPGSDYYFSRQLTLENHTSETAYLLPVGSLRGRVFQEDTLVPHAKVFFECTGFYGEVKVVYTDEFGAFANNWIPAGSCTIHASSASIVGSESVMVGQGEVASVDIALKSPLSTSRKLFTYLLPALILVLGLIIGAYALALKRRRRKALNAEPPEHAMPAQSMAKDGYVAAFNRRLEDISRTLAGKERQLVEYLFRNGETGQAKIVYTLGIPKTSLVRMLEKLEAKNIIHVERFGKAKKIQLTSWILEKE